MATVNATEFGRLFNMTSQRVGDLINQGMPAGKAGHRGSPRQIDIPLAVDWLITRAVARIRRPDGKESLEDAETRLKRASADLAEIRAAEAANRVMDTEEVMQIIDRMMVMCGSQLDALGGRLAGRVASESEPSVCRQIIFDECRQIRSALAAEFEKMAEREAAAGPLDAPEPPADA